MEIEEIIRVNYKDEEIGYATKEEAHRYGWLHRAFSIFIKDGDRMLIQRRNPMKYHSGGLWTNACCSHPRKGEELSNAVHRRLLEEMGFDCELQEVTSFVYHREFEANLHEFEYDHVFVGEYTGEVNINPEEASEYQWILIDDLTKWIEEKPNDFTTWFIIALSYVLN